MKKCLVTFVQQNPGRIHFLFLSATPVYQKSFDIIWILNVMHINDRNGNVRREEIFDQKGEFRLPNGKNTFIRKAIGYVSFVRGENPYTFPYRIYPKEFAKENNFSFFLPPLEDYTGAKILTHEQLQHLDLFIL